jgi:hypothetical protein
MAAILMVHPHPGMVIPRYHTCQLPNKLPGIPPCGSVAVTWTGHNEPRRMGRSGSKTEELIDETDFAC